MDKNMNFILDSNNWEHKPYFSKRSSSYSRGYSVLSLNKMRKEVATNSAAIWVLRMVGLWYPDTSSKYFTVYKVYSLVYFVTYVIHVFTMVLHACQIYDDIEALSASIYILSIKLIGVYKVIYILKGMKFSQDMISIMDQKMFQPKDSRQENMEKSLFDGWKLRTNFLLFGVFNTVLFLNVSPFIDGISKMRLPFASWYPFDYKRFPIFQIMFVYQSLESIYAGCINVGADVFNSQILSNISIQCNLLSDTLNNLWEYSREDVDSLKVAEKSTLENMNKMLIQCIKHHKAILSYSKNAESLFNLGVFGQLSATCIIMCMNMLQMSWLNPRSGEFLALLVYQIAICMTLLTYCWHGNEVMFTSMNIPLSAYNCPWFECSQEFKKNFIFFIHRTQKPIIIRTLHFFPVFLPTFIAIIRSSYSFYAVLRTVHEP